MDQVSPLHEQCILVEDSGHALFLCGSLLWPVKKLHEHLWFPQSSGWKAAL